MPQLRIVLIILLILIQYPLWFGKGGWLSVWASHKQIEAQEAQNRLLAQENQKIQADIDDLKKGTEAIEEHARRELNMIKQNEIYIQYPQQVAK